MDQPRPAWVAESSRSALTSSASLVGGLGFRFQGMDYTLVHLPRHNLHGPPRTVIVAIKDNDYISLFLHSHMPRWSS